MTSRQESERKWRHKNKLAITHAVAPAPPTGLRFRPRTSDATIHERQSASLRCAKQSGRRQPSMPKFNLPEVEP